MDKSQALRLYRQMVLIRKFEEKLYELFLTRVMPGTMHQYNGEEAVAVGVCAHLTHKDYVTSTHRGHGHCLAKGANLNAVMAEMFAKSTGCCKGMGGSMHIADFSVGMLGANGIVAAGIPIAVGAAWRCKYKKTDQVAVSFFGDGAVNEGAFHEAVNLAAAWNLPAIFICENNLYGYSTHYKRTMRLENISDRAKGYGIPGITVDGMNVLAVYDAAGEAIARTRQGEGPTLIECKTYRYRGHSRMENPTYRTKEEVSQWKERDPVICFPRVLREQFSVTDAEINAIDSAVDEEIAAAVRFAEESPDPTPADCAKYIFA